MNIVMLSPATRPRWRTSPGAGRHRRPGDQVGDQPPHALPEAARSSLAHYEHVNLADEGAVLDALAGAVRHASIDQVECLWEPYMILAARIRRRSACPASPSSRPCRSGTRRR